MWSLVEAEGTCPSPRDKLASGVIGKKMFIFGGFGPKSTDGVDVRNMAVYVIKPTLFVSTLNYLCLVSWINFQI